MAHHKGTKNTKEKRRKSCPVGPRTPDARTASQALSPLLLGVLGVFVVSHPGQSRAHGSPALAGATKPPVGHTTNRVPALGTLPRIGADDPTEEGLMPPPGQVVTTWA